MSEYTDEMVQGLQIGLAAINENPMTKLLTIAQAAANLATVAKVMHDIGYDAAKNPLKSKDIAERAVKYLTLRDDAIDRVATLIGQIKDTAAPAAPVVPTAPKE